MVAGRQYTDSEKAELEENLRAPIVFNRIDPVISAVNGHQINNRQEVRYIPREQGDVKVNELYTAAASYVDDNSDAYDEISDAFHDALVCGMGWTETRISYDEDPEGKIYGAERIPFNEMKWDPSAKKRNLADTRYRIREKWWDKSEAEEKWPAIKKMDVAASKAWVDSPEEFGGEHDASRAWMYENDASKWFKKEEDEILILQVQYYELETFYQVGDPQSGQLIELTENKFNKLKDRIEAMGARFVKQRRRKYLQAFILGDELLEQGDAPCKHDFTLQCITGKRDTNKNHWFGMVRAMIDPQKWSNKFFSEIQDIMSSNRTGGAFVESSALEDPRKAEEIWNDPNPLIIVADGSLGRGAIQERNPIQYPQGLDRLMEWAVMSIPQVTGVNTELLGLADREQSGVLELQRKKAGMTILAGLFDSLKSYRRSRGRVLLYFIEEYIADGRLIRITGEDGIEQYVQLMKDEETKKYDVIVDDSPSSPNAKEETYAVLSAILPQLLQAGLPVPPELLDYTPLPSQLTEKWKKMIEDGKNNPEAQKAAQLEERLKTAEALKDESVAELNKAKAKVERLEAQMKPYESLSKVMD